MITLEWKYILEPMRQQLKGAGTIDPSQFSRVLASEAYNRLGDPKPETFSGHRQGRDPHLLVVHCFCIWR